MTAHPSNVAEVETPECERMAAVADDSQKIGHFLDWLVEKGLVLAEYRCPHGWKDPTECEESKWCNRGENESVLWRTEHGGFEKLLADYFNIDLNKVEAERRALLDALRRDNA